MIVKKLKKLKISKPLLKFHIFNKVLVFFIFLLSFNFSFALINDGLVAYYPLDNISKFNSTVNGAQTLLVGSYGVEQFEDFINLTRGEESFVYTQTNLTPFMGAGLSQNWSVSMWFKSQDLDNNCCQCLWSQDGGDSGGQHTYFSSSDYVTLAGVDGGSLSTSSITGEGDIWHNYIIMHEYLNSTNSNWTMIMDNNPNSDISDENSSTTGYLRFGDYSGSGSNGLEGGLRDIAIYNRTLTASEIQTIYLTGGVILGDAAYEEPTPENLASLIEEDSFTVRIRGENNTLTNCKIKINDTVYDMDLASTRCSYSFNLDSFTSDYTFQVFYNTSSQNNLNLSKRTINSLKYNDYIKEGIVAYFPLDSVNGLNSIINGHTLGTGSYGVTQMPDYINITRGVQSYLRTLTNYVPYEGLGLTRNWSVSMWFMTQDIDNNCCQCLWSQRGGDNGGQHSPLTSGESVSLYGVSGGSLGTPPFYEPNVWHNYIIMHEYLNSTNSKWYMVMDNYIKSDISDEHSATTGYLILGDYSGGGGNALEGGIRDIAIYSKILSSDEIEELYSTQGEVFTNTTYVYPTPNNQEIIIEEDSFTIRVREEDSLLVNCNVAINGISYSMDMIKGRCVYNHSTSSISTNYTFQVFYNTTTQNNLNLEQRTIISYKYVDLFNNGLMAYFPLNSEYRLNSMNNYYTLTTGSYGVTQMPNYINLTRGENSYLRTPLDFVPYRGLGLTKNWTVSMWFKTYDLNDNSYQCLWRQYGGDSNSQHSPMINSSSDKICLYSTGASACTQPVLGENIWHNYLIMHEYLNSTHSNWTIILDNVTDSDVSSTPSATTGFLALGTSSAGSNNLEGGFRDIVFYNRILNSSEIDLTYSINGTMDVEIPNFFAVASDVSYIDPTLSDNSNIAKNTTIINVSYSGEIVTDCILHLNNGSSFSMNDYGTYCSYTLGFNSSSVIFYNYYVEYEIDLANYDLENRSFTYYPRNLIQESDFPAISILGLIGSLLVIFLFI